MANFLKQVMGAPSAAGFGKTLSPMMETINAPPAVGFGKTLAPRSPDLVQSMNPQEVNWTSAAQMARKDAINPSNKAWHSAKGSSPAGSIPGGGVAAMRNQPSPLSMPQPYRPSTIANIPPPPVGTPKPYKPTVPALPMPKPSIAGPSNFGISRLKSGSANAGGMGPMASIAAAGAMGAAVGAAASYSFGGEATNGAIAGAMGAAITAGGIKSAGKFGGSQFTKGVSSYVNGSENAMMRRSMYMGGAGLAGFAFGGDRSHKRGFNKHRGNSIGR